MGFVCARVNYVLPRAQPEEGHINSSAEQFHTQQKSCDSCLYHTTLVVPWMCSLYVAVAVPLNRPLKYGTNYVSIINTVCVYTNVQYVRICILVSQIKGFFWDVFLEESYTEVYCSPKVVYRPPK